MSRKTKVVKQRKFNRYDALLAEIQRLQLSKLKLLQNTSIEMQKLREFIKLLCQIEDQKQISPETLKQMDTFNNDTTNNNDDKLTQSIQLYADEYLSSFTSFTDLEKEIKRLRKSKFELINITNNEINDMRDTIKLLMNRIGSKTNIKDDVKSQTIDNVHNNNNEDILLHNYSKLGKDDVVNIMLMGTKCSGKTVLLRNIICLYDADSRALTQHIKNAKYIIINSIISSIYTILAEYDFFQSDKYLLQLNLSENMKNGIEYFRKNRLSKYDGPFLTKDIGQHITAIFSSNLLIKQTSDDDEFVRLAFRNNSYYRNMYYFYHNINKYCTSNWYLNTEELLLIWDKTTLPIYYYDIQLDHNDHTLYRFWDISSDVLYDANIKYTNNLRHLFEYINASCIIYMTSPIFNYQIEKHLNKYGIMEETSMRRSIKYFEAMFEKKQVQEDSNCDNDILERAQSKWELVPIMTLLNKCDIFKMEMESSTEESKTILLTFPEYDGAETYESIINYLQIIFKSFKMYHKRPYHIYETVAVDAGKVKTIVHHIKTMTNLNTTNKRLNNQINMIKAF